jgi:hypothetical protein
MKIKLFRWILLTTLSGCYEEADPLTLVKKNFEPNANNLFLKTNGY